MELLKLKIKGELGMSKNLMVRCFMINASEEGKEVLLTNLDTTKVEKVNVWSIVKDNLIVNGIKINVKNLYESHSGYELHNNRYLLEVI